MVRTPDWLLERRKRAERALATAREILGIDVTTAEDGAGWLTFLRSLTAGGLSGVRLITSDAHAGLINAIGASLPGASWQRLPHPLCDQCDGGDPDVRLARGTHSAALGPRSTGL
jgi:Transposase, Mutator family